MDAPMRATRLSRVALGDGGVGLFTWVSYLPRLPVQCHVSPPPCPVVPGVATPCPASPKPRRQQRTMDSIPGHDEEEKAFLPPGDRDERSLRRNTRKSPARWLRLALECAMAVTILVLLIFPVSSPAQWTSRRSPVPVCKWLQQGSWGLLKKETLTSCP